MKRIAREFRVYSKHIRIHMLSGLEYKGWWLMLIQVIFVVVTDPLSTVLLFSRFGNIGEWTVERIILVYALAVASFGIAESLLRGFDSFPWRTLRSGDFDRLLLRPCSLFTQVASAVFHIHRLARPVTAMCAVVWALNSMGVELHYYDILILLSAIIGGTIMYCGVFILTSGIAFFTIKGLDWIFILTNASYQITRCPEPYMPKMLKGVFCFILPVLVVSFYPASNICGWGYPEALGWLPLPAGVLFMVISVFVWRIGVRHYKSTGS